MQSGAPGDVADAGVGEGEGEGGGEREGVGEGEGEGVGEGEGEREGGYKDLLEGVFKPLPSIPAYKYGLTLRETQMKMPVVYQ